MKKVIMTLILVLSFAYVIPVHAEDAWPKSFTRGEYTYSIEGVVLNVYEINRSDTGSDGSALTNSNYLNDTPNRKISLNASDFTINPEYLDAEINKVGALVIDINLNMTKEKLEDLLQTEINSATEDKAYLVELAVKYKFTNYPSKYNHVYKVNILKTMINTMMNNDDQLHLINLAEVNEQVVNLMGISYDSSTNETSISYETTASDSNGLSAYVLNYQALFEKAALSNDEYPSHIIMFHNIDNIDYVINAINEDSIPETPEEPKPPVKDEEVVKVEDTSSNIPIYLYAASLITLLYGSAVVIYTIEKQKA